MMTNGIFAAMLSAFAVTLLAPSAFGQEDVRSVKLHQQGLKVIEEKCLVCHNRQRIDAAIKERKDMERVMSRMEKKGVVVTEKERRVIGHFWQQPFKPKGTETGP
jgi:hypothetical protein